MFTLGSGNMQQPDLEALKKDFHVVNVYGRLAIMRKPGGKQEIYSLEEFKERLGGRMTAAEIVLFFHD